MKHHPSLPGTQMPGSMLSQHEEIIRDRLIFTAQNMFIQYGVKSVSISDLAREASMAKKAFYHYFSGKEELVAFITSKVIEENKSRLLDYKEVSDNVIEEVCLGAITIRNFLKHINGRIFFQIRKYYPEAFKIVSEFQYDFLYNHFKCCIETGVSQGLFRSNLQPDIMARYIITAILTPSIEDIFWKEELNSEEIERQLLNYHLHAMATLKGLELMEKYDG